MRRQTRRRAYVVAVAALVGVTAPLWAPPVLSHVALFQVEEVGVVGTRYVPPDEVVRRADVATGATVWDDPAPWERRVEAHPLVREATVSRTGVDRLEIQVREAEPVALVPGSELEPVDASGQVLPLDPAESGLDLPILVGPRVEDGRVAGEDGRALLGALVALREAEPGFVRHVSEVGRGEHGGVRVRLTGGQACDLVLLPADEPVRALRRVERALGQHGGAVEAADARFDGQVVLRPGDDGRRRARAEGPGDGAGGGRG